MLPCLLVCNSTSNIGKFHLQTNESQAHWEIKALFLLKTSLYSFHCCSCISSSHLDCRTSRTDLAPCAFLLSTFSCIFLCLLYMACLIDLTSTGKRSVVSCFAISVWILYRKPSYRFPSLIGKSCLWNYKLAWIQTVHAVTICLCTFQTGDCTIAYNLPVF
jgi:amino acid permease